MIGRKISKAVGLGLLVCSSTSVFADADIAVSTTAGPLEATANVDLCVVVPQILVFGVGATGDAIAKLQWTHTNAALANNSTFSGPVGTPLPFTAPAPLTNPATASVEANGGAGSSAATNVAELPVFLFSNSGTDVTITTSVNGGATGAGAVDALDHTDIATNGFSIPISTFAGADGGNISHPLLENGESADTAHTLGVVNLSDTWTYTYTNAVIPAAGTYEARVTYVASTP